MFTLIESFVTVSVKTGLIAHDNRFLNKLSYQNLLDLSGLLSLAVFPKNSDNPYEWSGALMKLWPAW